MIAAFGLIYLGYFLQTELAINTWQVIASMGLHDIFCCGLLAQFLVVMTTYRWHWLIKVFDGRASSFIRLYALYLVGHFYNTFVPGAIGGDILRGSMTQDLWLKGKTAFVVVGIERILGVLTLALMLIMLSLGAIQTDTNIVLYASILIGTGLAVFFIIWRSGWLTKHYERYFHTFRDFKRLPLICLYFLACHLVSLYLFYRICLAFGLDSRIETWDLLLIFPISVFASVVPLSIFGAGARELTFVSMLTQIHGIEGSTALGVAGVYLGCLWFPAILGGLIQVTALRQLNRSDVDGTNRSSSKVPPPN